MKVVFLTTAEDDLVSIYNYISKDLANSVAAHNISRKILKRAQDLANFPEMGTRLENIDSRLSDYHYLVAGNYLIIYNIASYTVRILRILYAKADYAQLLQS